MKTFLFSLDDERNTLWRLAKMDIKLAYTFDLLIILMIESSKTFFLGLIKVDLVNLAKAAFALLRVRIFFTNSAKQ